MLLGHRVPINEMKNNSLSYMVNLASDPCTLTLPQPLKTRKALFTLSAHDHTLFSSSPVSGIILHMTIFLPWFP